ncbi:glycosyltransferase, partial [candidate division WOR-3 bacterium]|nr:glycosyltransferase [candidate division WOR-3 bacterium]
MNKFGIRAIVMPQKRDLPKFLDGSKRIKKYFRRIWLFFRITYIVRKEKIKLILSRGFYMGLEGMLIAKIFGLKSVFDFHGFAWQEEIHKGYKYKQLLTKTLERICIKKSDFVIAQTKSNKNTIKDLNKNVIVLRNGVNLQEFTKSPSPKILHKYSIPTTKPVVGFIGNWENWMNVTDLLKASQYIDNISIVIVGKGKSVSEYKSKYKDVVFTGRICHKDAMGLLMHFDICVAPYSKDEIMIYKSAVKTLEYMAAGKALIISNVIGKEDFLEEGVNCLTYEPGNPK